MKFHSISISIVIKKIFFNNLINGLMLMPNAKILKEDSSSVYGVEAVTGVVNILFGLLPYSHLIYDSPSDRESFLT